MKLTAVALLCFGFIYLIAPAADAQVLIGMLFGEKLTTDDFHIGLNVGANLAGLDGVEDGKTRSGLVLGLTSEWQFAGNFYLQPEILPFFAAGSKGLPTELAGPDVPGSPLTAENTRRELGYFAIPVILKYRPRGGRFLAGAGPQFNFLNGADDIYSGIAAGRYDVSENIEGLINDTDKGICFHLEYKMKDGLHATGVVVRYYLGLDDIRTGGTSGAMKNRVFSLVLSLPITGK